LIWTQQSIQGNQAPQSVSLFYSQSKDGGHTFSDAEAIVKEPVGWRELKMDGKGNLHLLWQPQDTLTTVWDQISSDGGSTWQFPQGLPDIGALEAVATDIAGRIQLVGVGPDALGHWLWDGGRWQTQEPLSLALISHQENPVELLASVVNKQGKMMVVMAVPATQGEVGDMTIHYATRTLSLPPQPSVTQEVPTKPVLTPTSHPATATPAELLTPTALTGNLSPTEDQNAQVEPNDRMSPFTSALVPVVLLLLGVMGYGVWRATRVKDR
jgi:hypothetical protein